MQYYPDIEIFSDMILIKNSVRCCKINYPQEISCMFHKSERKEEILVPYFAVSILSILANISTKTIV